MVNIKKLIILILVVSLMLIVSGCKHFRSEELDKTKEEQESIGKTAGIIIDAFSSQSVETLKEIMSNTALKSSDFDKGFHYCCELFSEKIVGIDKKGCPISGHVGKGEKYKKADASFNITLSSGAMYNLYFEYWFENDKDKDKIGVNRIRVVD